MVINAPERLTAEQVQPIDRTSSCFVVSFVKRTVIIKSIDGESRSETSSDIFGELYWPRFRRRFSQDTISRQAQSPETKIPAYGKRAGSIYVCHSSCDIFCDIFIGRISITGFIVRDIQSMSLYYSNKGFEGFFTLF